MADLLRPIRARWWLIVLVAGIALGVSLLLSLSQSKKYTAVASAQFEQQSQELSLVGVGVVPTLTPQQLASQAVQTILEPTVVQRARRSLPADLRSLSFATLVGATVNPNSTSVDVEATAASPSDAARIANAFANAAVSVANHAQQAAFARDATRIAIQRVRKSNEAGLAAQQEEVARLRQLATIASPAQVLSTATPPTAPSSPKPLRNAVLAGCLGILVGLLVVYVWDALDQRLRRVGDVERQFGYPLVGRVRDGALGHSPNARDSHWAVEPADWEQFRILTRNLHFLGENGSPRTFAVTSAVPEEGKTTVACFAAFAAAASGKRTLLVECDLRRPALAQRLSLRKAPGLTDFVEGSASPVDILQVVGFDDAVVTNGSKPVAAVEASDGREFRHQLVCVTAGSPTNRAVEILESSRFRQMLNEVRSVYDVVILDTPPILPVVDALDIVEKAEAIVVCGRTSKLTRGQARAGKQSLDHLPKRPVGLVVTGLKPSNDDSGYSYAYSYYAS